MFTGNFILINNDGDPTKPKHKFKKKGMCHQDLRAGFVRLMGCECSTIPLDCGKHR